MSKNNGMSANRRVQAVRLAAQILCLVITVVGAASLIRGMGLPKWAFVAVIALAGLFFCGWVCPFGTVQEWLRHVGKNVLGVTLAVPPRIDRYLQWSRYLLIAAVALFAIDIIEPRHAFSGFFAGRVAETAAYVMMGVLFALSLFMDRPFCRYLCGHGAQYGILTVLRVFTVKREKSTCVGCKKCDAACPMGVAVSTAAAVRHPNCINCFRCVTACPVSGALRFGPALPRPKKISLKQTGAK